MPLVSMKEILCDARKNRYGVMSLLGGNLEMMIGHIMAAEEQKAPLILTFTQEVTPKVPLELGMPMLVNAAKRAKVPVATILDHGDSLETVVRAIHLGTSAVMFDGSALPYEDNIEQTREIVKVAHALGVSVEAELGSITGSATGSGGINAPLLTPDNSDLKAASTDPEQAAEFVERTGVDALAISFGNVHGTYHGEPNLDLDLVGAIYSQVDIPLVMHGASGLEFSQYPAIVASGISKICYYTAAGIRAANDIRLMLLDAGKDGAAYHEIISRSIDFFKADTVKLMKLLGCSGVA